MISESKLRLVKNRIWKTVFVKSKQARNIHCVKYTIDLGVKTVFDFAKNGILLCYHSKIRSLNTVNLSKSYQYVIHPYCYPTKYYAIIILGIWDILRQYELDRKTALKIGNNLCYIYL